MPLYAIVLSLLLVSPVCSASSPGVAELVGPVDGEHAAPLIQALDDAPADEALVVTVDSMGGSVGVGEDILASMRKAQRRGVILVCVVDGWAASMAAVILQQCDVRVMRPGSVLLFHGASTQAHGTAQDLAVTIKELNDVLRQFAILVASKMHLTVAEFEAKVALGDWLLSPEEALALGAIDVVGK